MNVGRTIWAIAEGYIPEYSMVPGHGMMSHEKACILNTNEEEARIELTVYFADQEPVGPYHITVPPKRTKHLQFSDLWQPQAIPTGKEYSSVFISNIPVVIQHSRVDSRQMENSLLTTIAFSQ